MKRNIICLIIVLMVAGCDFRGKKVTRTDTPTSGVAEFVSDDCFGNVVQEAVNVFEATNRDASLLPIYMSENEAINLLLCDSVRLAILARDLTEQEKQSIMQRNEQLVPRVQKLAIDGIAIIVHKDNPDTLISVETLQKIMTGGITSWRALNPTAKQDKMVVVFDHSTSSTVRFIKDSICKGEPLTENLYSVKDNLSVLDYVIRTPNAMGIIGVNWISNPNDSTQLSFNQKVRTMSVSRTHPATAANSYKPFPAYLYLHYYPLTREVYLALTDLRGTLPAGFAHFILGDRGQRLILKSGLVPANRPMRTVLMNN